MDSAGSLLALRVVHEDLTVFSSCEQVVSNSLQSGNRALAVEGNSSLALSSFPDVDKSVGSSGEAVSAGGPGSAGVVGDIGLLHKKSLLLLLRGNVPEVHVLDSHRD